MPRKYVFVVFTRPAPGRESEYNAWYDDQHLPDVLKLPGFVSAARYRYTRVDGTNTASHPYLALYTLETDDIAATQAALDAAANTPSMLISDALDLPATQASYFEWLREDSVGER